MPNTINQNIKPFNTKRNEKGKSLLEKSSGIPCKGNQLTAYQFLDNYQDLFSHH